MHRVAALAVNLVKTNKTSVNTLKPDAL